MQKVMRIAGAIAALAVCLGGCAGLPGSAHTNEPLVKGPPITTDVSPYQPALSCLSHLMNEEQHKTTFGVLSFPDKTDKFNSIADGGTGRFSTQGGEDRLITALHAAGVRVVQTDDAYLRLLDLYIKRELQQYYVDDNNTYTAKGMDGEPVQTHIVPSLKGSLRPIQFLVSGSIDSLDFLPGQGGQVTIAGIGGGFTEYRLQVGMTAKATRMPIAGNVAGDVVVAENLLKQVYGYESSAGVASFFNGSTYTSVNIGKDGREPTQYVEGVMLDRVAYDMVSGALHIHQCDPQRDAVEGRFVKQNPPEKTSVLPQKTAAQ